MVILGYVSNVATYKAGSNLIIMVVKKLFFVPEAGLEPARTQCSRDFKSLVSTIPPFRQPLDGSKKEVRLGTSSDFVAATEKNSA